MTCSHYPCDPRSWKPCHPATLYPVPSRRGTQRAQLCIDRWAEPILMLVSVRTMAQEKRQRRRSKEAAETSSTASDLHDELHSFHNTVHHYCNTNSDGRVRHWLSSGAHPCASQWASLLAGCGHSVCRIATSPPKSASGLTLPLEPCVESPCLEAIEASGCARTNTLRPVVEPSAQCVFSSRRLTLTLGAVLCWKRSRAAFPPARPAASSGGGK